MDSKDFEQLAKDIIVDSYNAIHPNSTITTDNVFTVWLCKTLQNNKGLFGINIPENQNYYEATYNGDKKDLYLDIYDKIENRVYGIN